MALDGIAVAYITRELRNNLLNGRIEKIYQPETDEIILTVKKNGSHKLLLSATAQNPRAHLTEISKENPKTAPLFCMVLRKHLSGGRVIDISQGEGLERIINFDVEAVTEMGDMARRRLIIEIMGKHSNIILLNDNGVILDSIKHITHAMSSVREVLPGRFYVLPPTQSKINPNYALDCPEAFYELVSRGVEPVQKLLYMSYMGISPITASEIANQATLDMSARGAELTNEELKRLYRAFCNIVKGAYGDEFDGELVLNEKGKAVDFAPFKLTLYGAGYHKETYLSMSELMTAFYAEKDKFNRITQKSQDLRRLVSLNIERCVKKHDLHQQILREVEGRDLHRLYGDLIMANLYRLTSGAKSATLENYNNGEPTAIPLDPQLTPIENAQRYYKRYNKEKRTLEALKVQMEQAAAELSYLESVMASLANAENEADFQEIREELEEQGFVKRRASKGNRATKKTPLKKALSGVNRFVSSDGFTILVGKNNRQNDELTQKNAAPDDVWLHAKDIPGSHVIIKTNGQPASNKALEEAAALAAYYSKARESSLVPVDYTLKKHVKKPSGAKPGMVIYTGQRTAFVKPNTLVSPV